MVHKPMSLVRSTCRSDRSSAKQCPSSPRSSKNGGDGLGMTILIAMEESDSDLHHKTGYIPELEALGASSASDPQTFTGELSARFSCLDEFYSVLLTRIVNALPDILPLLTVENFRDRLRHL